MEPATNDDSGSEKEERTRRFRERFHDDVTRQNVRTVEEYLREFPGIGDRIAREWVSWNARLVESADQVGPYVIETEIARGGQAIVYLATDTRIRRHVALKILHGFGGLSTDALKRFRREAEVLAKLDHPSICPVYETGTRDGIPWIAMRYVEGKTLAVYARRELAGARTARDRTTVIETANDETVVAANVADKTTVRSSVAEPPVAENSATPWNRDHFLRLLRVFEQVASALHAAHEAGVVHRDIKPKNILVAAHDAPVVLDFGLASAEESGADLTRTGELMGTPAYMSPEQLSGRRDAIDRRTDVWALGVALYECLTGARPFEGPTREALFRAILTKNPPDPRTIDPHLPPEISIVVATAIEKDPNRRYATAEAFAEDLRRVRVREPIAARPVSSILRLRRWAERNPLAAVLLCGIVAIVTAAVLLLAMQNRRLDLTNATLLSRSNEVREKSELAERRVRELGVAQSRVHRLADIARLSTAKAEAETLWPLGRALIPRARAWRERYASLVQALPEHERALADLEASALPWTDDEKAKDRGTAPAERAALEAEVRRLEAAKASDEKIDPLIEKIERLDREMRVRKTFTFAGDDGTFLTWMHGVLVDLVRDLRAFAEPKAGVYLDVLARIERSQAIVDRTIVSAKDAWDLCRERVKNSGEYAGLDLAPQEGLLPLGPDPDSHLEEFLHVASHAEGEPWPVRDAQGRLPKMTSRVGIVLVLLPGRSAVVGTQSKDASAPNYDMRRVASDWAATSIAFTPFFIAKYETSRGQWQRIGDGKDPGFWGVGKAGKGFVPEDLGVLPVEYVSWTSVTTVFSHVGLMLPNEQEWEYACRAGSGTSWFFGDRIEDLPRYGNIADRSAAKAFGATQMHDDGLDDGFPVVAPIGSFLPNRFGLFDMLGNVFEWCDVAPLVDGAPPTSSAAPNVSTRPARGGSFYDLAERARSSFRNFGPMTIQSYDLGCRAARAVDRAGAAVR